MFPELAALVFMSSEFGHRAHLATTSYSAHMALNDFYTGMVDLRDKLVEVYQGRNGIVNIPYCDPPESTMDPAATLRQHLKIVEEVRYTAIPQKDTTVQNVVDEIVGLYLSTIYKIENLK
jgi:hypothetical protein